MKVKSFDNKEIYYKKKGKGKCLFFMHGAGSNHTIWKPILEHYSKSNKIIAMDSRGHGHSTDSDFKVEDCVEDIKAILDKENVKKVILVGSSLSSNIAYQFYEKHPERVEKMIFVTPYSNKITRFYNLWRLLLFIPYALTRHFKIKRKLKFQDFYSHRYKPIWMSSFVDLRGTLLRTYVAALRSAFAYKINFKKIKVPTLIIEAKKDPLAKKKRIKEMFEKHKYIKIMITNTTHFIVTKNPKLLIKIIDGFLE